MSKFEDLQFVRVQDPNIFLLIPRYLFRQIKNYDFAEDKLLKYGAIVVSSPFTYMFLLTTAENLIKGVFWARLDCIDEMFELYLMSVDPEYQGNGMLKRSLNFIRKLIIEERPKVKKRWDINLKDKFIFITTRPKAFKDFGCKPCKRVLMENTGDTNESSE